MSLSALTTPSSSAPTTPSLTAAHAFHYPPPALNLSPLSPYTPCTTLPALHHALHASVGPKLALLSASLLPRLTSSYSPARKPADLLAASYELELGLMGLRGALESLLHMSATTSNGGGGMGYQQQALREVAEQLNRASRKLDVGLAEGDWGFCWAAMGVEVPAAVERGWEVVRGVDREMEMEMAEKQAGLQ